MGEHGDDAKRLTREVNSSDQSVFVAASIAHQKGADFSRVLLREVLECPSTKRQGKSQYINLRYNTKAIFSFDPLRLLWSEAAALASL